MSAEEKKFFSSNKEMNLHDGFSFNSMVKSMVKVTGSGCNQKFKAANKKTLKGSYKSKFEIHLKPLDNLKSKRTTSCHIKNEKQCLALSDI